jgi:hypothetical protein
MQTPPLHRAHLRTWRLVVLATQTPPTRVLPAPHAAAACVIMPSGSRTGATGIACADDVMAKAKTAKAIKRIMRFSHVEKFFPKHA